MTAVAELREVSVRYAGSPPVDALRRVSVTVGDGEAVAVVGPSGSGKSTLLHVMGTLERPTAGRVWIAGQEVSSLSDPDLSSLRAWRIGFVFQRFHLMESLSALENVAAGLLYQGLPARQRGERAAAALKRVGLGRRLHHRPPQLSGGEQQRVAIARAVVGQPALVLADEPTGNLDSRSGREVLRLLLELHREGAALVLITHDQAVAAEFGIRMEMQDGEWR